MKVENVSLNYVGNRNLKRVAPNFTAAPGGAVRSAEEILNEVLPNANLLKFISYFDKWKGELGGILITAIGTGCVAPFSIAFNPFVKAKPNATEEEKQELSNTKKYTAFRQPISAVLAAFFQAGAIGPIDRVLDKWSNDPRFSKSFAIMRDQGSLQKKEYIEREIRKEMKNSAETAGLSKKEFKALLDSKVKARQKSQIDALVKIFEDTSQIKIGQNNSRVIPNSNVANYINQCIDEYIEDVKTLKYDSEGLAWYVNRASILINNKEQIQNILSPEKLEEYKGKPSELKKYLTSIRAQSNNKDLNRVLTEIIEIPDSLSESRCYRTLERIKKIEAACGGTFESNKYMQKLLDRNRVVEERLARLQLLKIQNPENATVDIIKETMRKLIPACQFDSRSAIVRDIFENTDVFQSNFENLSKKIRTDIIKTYKEAMEHSYKGFSQMAKIGIGVGITLPITCTALNWVYPRFMDIFFPKLAGKKTDNPQVKNGGDK